jgi:hypothetical protein
VPRQRRRCPRGKGRRPVRLYVLSELIADPCSNMELNGKVLEQLRAYRDLLMREIGRLETLALIIDSEQQESIQRRLTSTRSALETVTKTIGQSSSAGRDALDGSPEASRGPPDPVRGAEEAPRRRG